MAASRTKKVIGISSVIIVVILLHIFGALTPVENLFRRILTPGSKALYQWSITLGGTEQSFDSVEALQAAYTDAQEELIERDIQEAELFSLRNENEQLREQLSFFASSSVTHIGAEVIGKNIEPLGSTLVIDRGVQDGIQIGHPVIVRGGILIGTIVQSYDDSAVVKLLNDNQSKVAATITNRDKSIGLIEGGYGISIRMNFIPQNEQIFVGDLVITSGLTEAIPKGLLIGKIETVEKEAYQPFQEAIVTPAVDLNKIDLVSVILSDLS